MTIRKLCGVLALCMPLIANAETEQKPTTLVMVDDFAVTNMHFAVFSAQNPGNADNPKKQIALLNELVNTYMVANSPEGKALADNPEIAAALSVSRARLIAQAVIHDYLDNAEISQDALQALYEKEYGNTPGVELKARHILLETEDEAKAVIAELDKGGDFAKLAKEKSTGPSSSVGGDLGWFEPGQMVGAFSEALLKMQNGSYSKAPVKTQFGWHVILREDSRDVPAPSLDTVRAELEKKLRTQSLSEFVRGIQDNTKIEVVSGGAKVAE